MDISTGGFIHHASLTIWTYPSILQMIEDKKALFAIETCGVFVQHEVGKIPHHLK